MKLFASEQSPAGHISKSDLQRVLVMQLDDTSATVMLSPALRTLRKALPDAELTLMTSTAGSEVAPLLPWVDTVMVERAIGTDVVGNRAIDPREEVAFVERMRRHNFSIALIFTSLSQSPLRSAYACYLAGIPYRVGFAQGMSGSVLSHYLMPPTEDVHQVDRNLNLLDAIGIPSADQRMELSISQEVDNKARELLKTVGINWDLPYLVLAPGAADVLSPYNPDHFASVARILSAQTEHQLVVVGGSTEVKALQPTLQVASENLYGNIYSLVEKTTLPELAAIIRHASLTIASNSVIIQFADVFGCPMVILHSETDMVSQWMPRNASARLLSRPAICSHCCNQANCLNGINCLDIRPEEVAIAAFELLSGETYEPPAYEGILGYKIEDKQEQTSTR